MSAIFEDLRYALRLFIKRPGFTAVAVLTLGLAIGANTAIFSVVNAVVLRPLPFKDSSRLVSVWEQDLKQGNDHAFVGGANFNDWHNRNHVFESLAAYFNWNYNLTGRDEPQRLQAALVSGDFFQTLGAEAELGRVLLPSDDVDGKDYQVVISHKLWQSQFNANREVIGHTVLLNGKVHTIVGVMPAHFTFPGEEIDFWRPIAMSAQQAQSREGKWLKVIGRLKAGTSLEEARAGMHIVARQLELEYPNSNSGWGVNLVPLREEIVGKASAFLYILMGAVSFVLLIGCANIANLLLARTSSRQKEIAVRAALGASRWRLMRQLLIEALLLALAGSMVGLFLALSGTQALIVLNPGDIPRLTEAHIDGSVLGFTFVLSLFTTLAFGLVPAWQASALSLNFALKDEGRSTSGKTGSRYRNLLVIAEVAVTVILLIGAGLLLKSFVHLQKVNPGFNTHDLLTMEITLPAARYGDNQKQINFFKQTLERIKTLPDVQSVGAVQDLPLRLNTNSFPISIEGRPAPQGAVGTRAIYRAISDDYFRTLGIPIVQGRGFTVEDDERSIPVIVINQTMARQFWPNEDPLGKRIRFGEPGDPTYSIVGVVGDIKHMGPAAEEGAVMYQPHAQKHFDWLRWMTIVVRTNAEPLSLTAAVRGRIHEVDKDLPIYNIATMDQLLVKSLSQPRFSTFLMGVFSLLALVLATLGVYGVMSFVVAQRSHEVGVRMALGGQIRDVITLIVVQGMKVVLIGVAIGLMGAVVLTRLMKTLLFNVSSADPLTFGAVALMLAQVAVVACYIPARRAAKVNPLEALRYE